MSDSWTFLLIHGAWHGGWCWQRVADRLVAQGHRVLAPTLPGLDADDGSIPADVSLQTHIDAVIGIANAASLLDFILVGHSYAGLVITGAADVLRERVRHYVYLDAAVPDSMLPGTTYRWADANTPEERESRLERARTEGGGIGLPPPPPEAFGVFEPGDAQWLQQRLRPMPLQTYLGPVTLKHGGSSGLQRSYVAAQRPLYGPLVPTHERIRQQAGWSYRTIDAGHDMMVTAPELVADLLVAIASES